MLFTGGLFIKLDETRCLNYLHHDVGCNHCVSHCPGDALKVEEHRIGMDQERCLGCGLCFADCPTEVFRSDQWHEETIIEEIKKQSARVTQFFCGYNDTPFRREGDRATGAVQVPTCLSSISKGGWYEIGLLTAVELRLEKCHQCPMRKSLPRMKLAVETAMEWIAACGHTCEFSYIYQAETVQKRKKLKAAAAGLQVTSRRDLFLFLFKQGKEVAQQVWEKSVPCQHRRAPKAGMGNCLPSWQQRLEQSYNSRFREGGTPAYWPSIVKDDNCMNCGLCSANCPTQALQIRYGAGKARHVFTPGHCLDCRICSLFCPTKAITRDRRPNASPFAAQVILEKAVVQCRRCGQYMLPGQEDLCYWCRHEPTEAELLSDVWKHLLGHDVAKVYRSYQDY